MNIPEWEGKVVSKLAGQGFLRENRNKHFGLSGIKLGGLMTRALEYEATQELLKVGAFEDVAIQVTPDPANPSSVFVTIVVKEK